MAWYRGISQIGLVSVPCQIFQNPSSVRCSVQSAGSREALRINIWRCVAVAPRLPRAIDHTGGRDEMRRRQVGNQATSSGFGMSLQLLMHETERKP